VPTLGLLIFGVFLISKWIVKPISALAEASERVAGGEFGTKVRHQGKTIEFKTLLHSFNTMVSAVKNREDMLVQKNSQLELANRDYQELLSFVTHELNNSIGSLLLNVMMLSDGTIGVLQEEQEEVVQQILRDVERFRDMVKNYLNISRLEKGTLKFRPETVDLKKTVVLPVLSRLKSRIEHRQMRVDWEWKDETVLSVDTELMDICYSNLVVNALKYGKEWIRLSARKQEGWWILEVANGGTPIPAEKIPLLFKKFSRLVKSDDGAGLGLYLIRKILEQHGGEVWCAPLENGTSFYMKIPSSILNAQGVQRS
jgi:signal transduction histidine kinase